MPMLCCILDVKYVSASHIEYFMSWLPYVVGSDMRSSKCVVISDNITSCMILSLNISFGIKAICIKRDSLLRRRVGNSHNMLLVDYMLKYEI